MNQSPIDHQPTLTIIWDQHKALLLQMDRPGEVDLEPVQTFLETLAQAGATIQDAEDRSSLHELIRYWSSIINEKTGAFPVVQLQPFDASLPLSGIPRIRETLRVSPPSLRTSLFPKLPQSKPKLRISRRMLLIGTAGAVATGAVSSYFLLRRGQTPNVSNGTITVNFIYSADKSDWIREAADAFNQQGVAFNNKRIQIALVGDSFAQTNILNGKLQPTAWSPSSFLELGQLTKNWKQTYNQDIITFTGDFAPRSLVHTPLVFAVWQSRAEVLLRKYGSIDWPSIHTALTLKNGWADLGGPPEWGFVKFGQTQPDLSNKGLLTITLIAYAYFNKQSGLQSKDVGDPKFFQYFNDFENQVYCFGPSSGTFIDTVIQRGPNQVDIFTTYENLVLAKEREAGNRGELLYMSYPSLNILSDHPFAILQGDWVTPEQKFAARTFLNFLLSNQQQQSALKFGFRSYNEQVPITTPVSGNLFLKPPSFIHIKAEKDLTPLAQPPSGEVTDALVKLWQVQNYGRQC